MSHITLAASHKAFEQMFKLVRDHFTFAKSDSGSFGPFTASYAVALHLQNGNITLQNDNTIEISNLHIVFDTLKVNLCFDLPGFSIPSFCIVPDPWNGCLVGFPGLTIGGPICVPIDLSGLVSDINTAKANLQSVYYVDPGRLPGWSDLDAELAGKSNMWQLYINFTDLLVNPIDVPATVANILENAVKTAIDNLFPSWVPQWAKDIIYAAIGPIIDLIKSILNIIDSIQDFFINLLNNLFPLPGLIEAAIADHFASQNPIQTFEDPYPLPIPDSTGGLIPVKIPIRKLSALVNSAEMVLGADVGA